MTPIFIDDRRFWITYANDQSVVEITPEGADYTQSSIDSTTFRLVHLNNGEYMVRVISNAIGPILYKRDSDNFYVPVENVVDESDSGFTGSSLALENNGHHYLVNDRRYKLDRKREKFTRINSFENFLNTAGNPYKISSLHSGTKDNIILDTDVSRLMFEIDVTLKLDNSTSYNYDFIGIAKQKGKADESKKVLLITD